MTFTTAPATRRSDSSSISEEKYDDQSKQNNAQNSKAPVDLEEDSANVAVYEVGQDKNEQQDIFASDDKRAMRRMKWWQGAVVVAKSEVGVGILGLPGTFATLGFVPGLISLICLCSIASLSALYITRIRARYPQIHSVGDFGYMIGGRVGAEIFGWSYCIVFILFSGSALQTLTIAMNAITLHGLCTTAFAGILAAFLCIVGSIFHELERVAILSYLGLGTVVVANWVLTISIIVKGHGATRPEGAGNDVMVAGSFPFRDEINAVSTQLYALMGVPAFFSISAEMEEPKEFLKSVAVGHGFVVANFLLISILVYSRAGKYMASPVLGSSGPTLKIVCYAIALLGLFVSCLLLTHIGAKYVFVRFLRGTRHLASPTKTHWSVWSASFCGVLIAGFILACAVPVFGDLVSLIGALTGGFLIVGMTGLMGLFSLSVEGSDPTTGEKFTPPGKGWIQRSWNNAFHHGTWKQQFIFILSWFLVFAGLFITVGGGYGAIAQIISDSKSAGKPFSCADNSV